MYIRNSINFNLRNDIHDEALEFLCVEISKPKVKPFQYQRGTDPLILARISLTNFR